MSNTETIEQEAGALSHLSVKLGCGDEKCLKAIKK